MGLYIGLLVLGVAAGCASALLGIGGGVIMVPVLTFVFAKEWIDLPAGVAAVDGVKVAAATSLAYIVPVALAGALRSHEPVQWKVILLVVPGGLVGAYLGALAKTRISAAQIKVLFACLMLVAGLRLGLRGLREMHLVRGPVTAEASETMADEET